MQNGNIIVYGGDTCVDQADRIYESAGPLSGDLSPDDDGDSPCNLWRESFYLYDLWEFHTAQGTWVRH